MRAHFKPILSILLITPCLTELLSNNLPPRVFFNPLIFFFLATVAYGFPVLLLREFACRKHFGIPGLFCLGLAYGIINEGILAKTFYLARDVPINTFDHYGYVFGICIPWAITISVWHSLHAVLCPIFITYYFFPAHREQPWLTRASMIWLALPCIVISILLFFTRSKERAPGQLSHFLLMLACMGFLVWLATKAPRTGQLTDVKSFRLKPIAWGVASFLILLVVPALLPKVKIMPILFYGYFIVVLALIVWWLAKRPTIPVMTCLLFVIGNNLLTVAWAMPGALHRAGIQQQVANVLLLLVFALLLVRLWKDSRIHHDVDDSCAA